MEDLYFYVTLLLTGLVFYLHYRVRKISILTDELAKAIIIYSYLLKTAAENPEELSKILKTEDKDEK